MEMSGRGNQFFCTKPLVASSLITWEMLGRKDRFILPASSDDDVLTHPHAEPSVRSIAKSKCSNRFVISREVGRF